MSQSTCLRSIQIIECTTLKSVKNAYYAFLLDNIGPFPEEITQQLPPKVFDTISHIPHHEMSNLKLI